MTKEEALQQFVNDVRRAAPVLLESEIVDIKIASETLLTNVGFSE